MAEDRRDEKAASPLQGSAKRPLAGLLLAFVIVVVIIIAGAQYFLRSHNGRPSAANETSLPTYNTAE